MHQIGVGVLGPVFRTYEPLEGRLVAVKAFHLDITPEQARTLVEALERLVATVSTYPGVVAPIAVGLEDDVPYLAQEYVASESLDVAIRHYSPTAIGTVMPFIRQMAVAVDAAHERGVVHGALHLRDVFLTPDEARVTGFGIVRALEEIGLAGPIRRPYTAPEVIAGCGWDTAADRFALAAIAYELLTGRRASGTGDQVAERIRLVDGVFDPEHLEEVFAMAFANDPGDRYSSANRFVSALEYGVGQELTDVVGVESELNRHSETAPIGLLSGLELDHQGPSLEKTRDSVKQVESVVIDGPDSGVIRLVELGIEPRVSSIDFEKSELDGQVENQEGWSVGETTEFSLDVGRDEDAEGGGGGAELEHQVDDLFDNNDDDGVVPVDAERSEGHGIVGAGGRFDCEGTDNPTVSDQRYVGDDREEDDDGEEYVGVIPVLPSQAVEFYNLPSTWSRGVVSVLAIALVVGSIAYFGGVKFAPHDGPSNRSLETQSAVLVPVDMAGRELREELVEAAAAAPVVDVAGSALARPSDQAVETLSDSSVSIEAGFDGFSGTKPIQEPASVSLRMAGSPEVDQPGNRTARVPTAEGGAAFALLEVVTPTTGWVLVRTDPPGAKVALDGVDRGQTPLSLSDVSFGTHRLEVSYAGFGTVQREVIVNEADTVVPVGVRLTPERRSSVAAGDAAFMGSLAVRSRPPGAQVTVDKILAGVTPLVVVLPVGRYQVRIQGEGYQPWVTSVEVKGSEGAQVSASLEYFTR
jgi:serine/threonine protein kinase